MACGRDDHEARRKEAQKRADRLRESALPRTEGLVQDETSIEVSHGIRANDD